MPPDDTLRPLFDYTTALLRGICRKAFSLGHLTAANGIIFLRARLDPADLDDLAFADAHAGVRAVLARWGEIHQGANGQPLEIRFNFHDPRNDDLEFGAPIEPAALEPRARVSATRVSVARTERPRPKSPKRRRRGTG